MDITKPTRIIDLDGKKHDFSSDRSAFKWIVSNHKVDCNKNTKHGYMTVLEKGGAIERAGAADAWDTYWDTYRMRIERVGAADAWVLGCLG